jgi:hypothetical protein
VSAPHGEAAALGPAGTPPRRERGSTGRRRRTTGREGEREEGVAAVAASEADASRDTRERATGREE